MTDDEGKFVFTLPLAGHYTGKCIEKRLRNHRCGAKVRPRGHSNSAG